MAYIVRTDLEKRLSPAVVRSLYDDDNDGEPDDDPVAQLIADAESKVLGAIVGPGGVYATAFDVNNYPAELKRLFLDAAVAYAAQRHPEYVRREWLPLMQQLDAELSMLRNGKRTLGITTTPEPAANHGGSVVNDVPDTDIDRTFLDGMGDW